MTDTFFKQCAAIAYVPPPTSHDGIITRPRFIASTLLRREAWQAVKGFPEDLRSAEDLIFMDRVENAGYRFVFEPRAQVHWDLRPTLWSTFKRFVVYSRNNIRAGLFRQWQSTIRFVTMEFLQLLLALALDLRTVAGLVSDRGVAACCWSRGLRFRSGAIDFVIPPRFLQNVMRQAW